MARYKTFGKVSCRKTIRYKALAAKRKQTQESSDVPDKRSRSEDEPCSSNSVFDSFIICDTKTILAELGQNDYIPARRTMNENPYNTIEYLTKGVMTIKLPWMKTARTVKDSIWYANWLVFSWLVEPTISSSLSILFILEMDETNQFRILYTLIIFDLSHLVFTVTDFLYTLQTVVVDHKCQLTPNKLDQTKLFNMLTDIITSLLPYILVFRNSFALQVTRFSRIRYLMYYKRHFCTDSQSEWRQFLYRLATVLLGVHVMTCCYVKKHCEENENLCRFSNDINDASRFAWYTQYVFSLNSLINLHFGVIEVQGMNDIGDSFLKFWMSLLFRWLLYMFDIIILSKMICHIFIKQRNKYRYDYYVQRMLNYLSDAGVSSELLETVATYTSELWNRQKGAWIPELALQAPQCLRQDIMCSLYLHHLLVPALFRNIPHYFLRQLAARFRRTVILPEKYIVQAGDILPSVFFINEGEVEKYYTSDTGEKKIMGSLTTNEHFGIFQAVFPNTPFQCSYYTRTVVDLVYLQTEDWENLLESYPEIKKVLRDSTQQMGLELGIHEFFFK